MLAYCGDGDRKGMTETWEAALGTNEWVKGHARKWAVAALDTSRNLVRHSRSDSRLISNILQFQYSIT